MYHDEPKEEKLGAIYSFCCILPIRLVDSFIIFGRLDVN